MKKNYLFNALFLAVSFVPCLTGTAGAAEADVPEAGKCYTLRACTQNSLCIQEEADGSLTVAEYAPSNRCFWEFVPTGQPNRFYIRNLTTGHYIQSTNLANSTKVGTGTLEVEFYVGKNETSGYKTTGFWYFSSTDNAVFDKVSDETKGLNKDGGSSNVVAYMCGASRNNSYWDIEATDYVYEVHPFMCSEEVGTVTYKYEINASSGKNVAVSDDGLLLLQDAGADSRGQSWYFVGTSNADGGYLILSAANHKVVGPDNRLEDYTAEATRWCVSEVSKDDGKFYVFHPYGTEGKALTVNGDSLFNFSILRSDFQLGHKIYNLPCGALGSTYITGVGMEGAAVLKPIHYPLSTLNRAGTGVEQNVSKPSSWYTFFTQDRGRLSRGQSFDLSVTLSGVPSEGSELTAYFDWNADGVFETSVPLAANQNGYAASVDVPSEASLSDSRMRIRLTDNGMTGAEDDVNGQTLDLVISTADASDGYMVKVNASAADRGTVSLTPEAERYEGGTQLKACAQPLGNAKFVCWREGRQVVSLDTAYTFNVNHETTLTAYFSPKTSDVPDGIGQVVSESGALVEVEAGSQYINIVTDAPVQDVSVYSVGGALVAQSASKRVSVSGLTAGSYIVKVQTSGKNTTAKVFIK